MNPTKAQQISRAILSRVTAGMSVRDAIDEVLGAGTSSKLVSEIYDTLRAGVRT
jgi:DNA integrity scanning protein DisA with diadenylate cyclase activity